MALYPVPKSAEWHRINNLPRRTWDKADALQLAERWSPQLLNRYGQQLWEQCSRLTHEARERELAALAKAGTPIRMKPEQAMIGYDFVANKGVYVIGPVGVGKTFALWLVALLSHLHFGTVRPVLMLPASLVDDAEQARVGFSQVWQSPSPVPRIVSYQALGMPSNEFLMCACEKCTRGADDIIRPTEELRPDLWLWDEASKLRNADAAVSARCERYVANHFPICAPMTGTPVRKSLRNFDRPLLWALTGFDSEGKFYNRSPLPNNWKDKNDWCQATDENPREGRRPGGALLLWSPPGCKSDLEAARRGVQARIAQTPGVIVIDEMSCDQPITVRVLQTPDDSLLDEAFYQFRKTEKTLDGWSLGDRFSVLRYATEMSCGFYSRWDPRPPDWYIDARNEWNQHVKRRIDASKHSGRPIDREGVVARLDRELDVYLTWKAAQKKFGEPNSVAVPVTYSTLSYAASWLKMNTPALVWVQNTWVGDTLSKMTGVPYFAGKGKTSGGHSIKSHPASQSAILSTHANSYGRNLQAWCVNLVIGPEHSAEKWEQQIGRTHRYGQERPVHYDVLVSCAENLAALDAAISEAHNAEQVGGTQQKILTAAWDWSNLAPEARNPLLIPEEDYARRSRWTAS